MSPAAKRSPVILVSSTVYGIEDSLDQIFAMLKGFGYEVWMSHKGTLPVDPQKTAFQNCLDAVEKCDLFLALITPFYGSGKDGDGLSITHQELLRAIELGKLRWILAHDRVAFARQLLKQYRFNHDGTANNGFVFKPTKVMDDIRVIDMYEAAIRHDVKLAARSCNWVQHYLRYEDAKEFVAAQFSDLEWIKQKIAEWNAA